MKTILILAGNSTNLKDTSPLRLDRELRDIETGLERAKMRDQFTLEKRLAVRQRDIQRAILDVNPQIVHFCGCSTEEDGLVFEDETGQPTLINPDALAEFFELFADRVECVVLNRCYSKDQGDEIAQNINYVVGTKRAISDRAAIEFVVGFYDALGAGRDYKFAYDMGRTSIVMAGIRERFKPVLLRKSDLINSSQNKNRIIEILSSYANNAKRLWRLYVPSRRVRRVQIILLSSLGVTALVISIRILGFLETLEFFFFDQMMVGKATEKPDPRLLLIQITPNDVEEYEGRKGAYLPDKTIAELLKKLLEMEPKVIGLDLYRDFMIEKDSGLDTYLQDRRIVGICKVPDPNSGNQGTTYPIGINQQQVGFSDLLNDEDSVVRRQLVRLNPQSVKSDFKSKTGEMNCGSKEPQMDSFSFKVAEKYLEDKPNVLNQRILSNQLTSKNSGGYQLVERGAQMLLNYRSVCLKDTTNFPECSPHKIALIKTVSEILKENIDTRLVKGKIVIIGTNIVAVDEPSPTPFSTSGDPNLKGFIMQAQMVSQLVSAAEDERPLLRVLPIEYEILWILGGSCVGVIIGQLCRSKWSLVLAGVIAPLSLYFFCLYLFSESKLWAPFVPTVLTLLGTGGVVVLIRFKNPQSS